MNIKEFPFLVEQHLKLFAIAQNAEKINDREKEYVKIPSEDFNFLLVEAHKAIELKSKQK